jgi:hypothetical protein
LVFIYCPLLMDCWQWNIPDTLSFTSRDIRATHHWPQLTLQFPSEESFPWSAFSAGQAFLLDRHSTHPPIKRLCLDLLSWVSHESHWELMVASFQQRKPNIRALWCCWQQDVYSYTLLFTDRYSWPSPPLVQSRAVTQLQQRPQFPYWPHQFSLDAQVIHPCQSDLRTPPGAMMAGPSNHICYMLQEYQNPHHWSGPLPLLPFRSFSVILSDGWIIHSHQVISVSLLLNGPLPERSGHFHSSRRPSKWPH